MALRNQPYLPLYVKDFLTDEKLIECSAEATGVYIRLMCILHSSQDYGQLKLSDKYNDEDILKNYTNMLCKQMPYTYEVVYNSLKELLNENVIFFDKKVLTQKRMFNDGILSMERAKAGKKGGKHSKQNVSKTLSKSEANTEYDNVIIINNKNSNNKDNNKHKYGEYKNVLLTDEEYTKLLKEYSEDKTLKLITYLDEYIEMKGYKAKSHYLCIKKWVLNAINENKQIKTNKEIIPKWLNEDIKSTNDNGENKEFKEFIEEFRKE